MSVDIAYIEKLKNFGYAPGGYIGKCRDCKDQFIAAKRSFRCEKCANIAANTIHLGQGI